ALPILSDGKARFQPRMLPRGDGGVTASPPRSPSPIATPLRPGEGEEGRGTETDGGRRRSVVGSIRGETMNDLLERLLPLIATRGIWIFGGLLAAALLGLW